MLPTTEEMLMMRPPLAFIMARSTARLRRNTDLRLVASTSSHSSPVMRASSLSLVMPALFTRIETSPNCWRIAPSTCSVCAASLTFNAMPAPLTPAASRYPLIARAPVSLVAVPVTVAPCLPSSSAMAWPMPRLAPVTSAICPSSVMLRSLCEGGQSQLQRFAVVDGQGLLVGVDAFIQACQHLARCAFGVVGDASFAEFQHGLDPAHRRIQLAHQRVPDRRAVTVSRDIGIVQYRDDWRLHCNIGEIAAQLFRRALEQLAVRRHAHRQHDRALRTLGLGQLHAALHGGAVPGDHHLAGRIEIHRFQHLALRALGTHGAHRLVVQAEDRGDAAHPFRHRSEEHT